MDTSDTELGRLRLVLSFLYCKRVRPRNACIERILHDVQLGGSTVGAIIRPVQAHSQYVGVRNVDALFLHYV
jgi:hypothetical protein